MILNYRDEFKLKNKILKLKIWVKFRVLQFELFSWCTGASFDSGVFKLPLSR